MATLSLVDEIGQQDQRRAKAELEQQGFRADEESIKTLFAAGDDAVIGATLRDVR